MELIVQDHVQIKYKTTICFILFMCICSIVSCRSSAHDRGQLSSTIAATNQNDQQQISLQTETNNDNDDKNVYGDLHPDKIRQIEKCNNDVDLMELCMRCAKATKSRIVYPMCCDNEDNVKNWCEDYVYYGLSFK